MKKFVTRSGLLLLSSFAWIAQAQIDVREGLVSYWPLDTVVDEFLTPDLVLGNDLTLFSMDSSSLTEGKAGMALTFDGVGYLARVHDGDRATHGLPIYGAGQYTVSLWVKGDGTTQRDRRVFSEGSDQSGTPLLNIGTDSLASDEERTGVVDIFLRGDSGTPISHLKSTDEAFDDQWHHIAWVDDNGTATLYVDGVAQATDFNYAPVPLTANTLSVGAILRAADSHHFTGLIDEVAIWERALSESEVQEVMTSGIATPVPDFQPRIVAQPSGATRPLGDRAQLSVQAIGTRTLSYQWQHDGQTIDGATGPTLTLTDLTPADTGNYTVVVSNSEGSTTSAAARLVVEEDPPADIPSGLISYWPFDTTTDGTTPDLYSANDMVLENMDESNLVEGQVGMALQFAGTPEEDEYVHRSGGFPIYNNPAYSVAFWVQGVGFGQNDRRIFSEASTGSNTPLFNIGTHPAGEDGSIRIYIRPDSGAAFAANSTSEPLDGTWHHIAWVDDNGQAKLYVDGVLDGTDFSYTRAEATFDTTSVGAILRQSGSLTWFGGLVDEVAVWNRALSITEVQEAMNAGIPEPTAPIPPAVTSLSPDVNVLSGADVSLSVEATGTSPLSFEWFKDGQLLEGQTDPILSLPNAQADDSGSYTVKVTNAADSVTSDPILVTIEQRPAPPAELAVDVNDTPANTPALTESGFHPFAIDGPEIQTTTTTRDFEGVQVSLSGSGGVGMSDRMRATPVASGDFTQELLLRDFVFSRELSGTEGLDLTIRFLKPNQPYTVTIWSFDTGSTGTRVADWFANGDLVQQGYSFGGQTLPTSDADYQFSFEAVSDASGTILIQGRRTNESVGNTGSPSFGVFLNAFRLVEAQSLLSITSITPGPGTLELTIESRNPQWEHHVEEKNSAAGGTWMPVEDLTLAGPDGNVFTATFPLPDSTPKFYRAVAIAPPAFFETDFESGAEGWTHLANIGTDQWELGTPTIGPGSAHSGDNAWGTGLSTPYEAITDQFLRSPEIDLTGVTSATLEFWEFRDVEPLFGGNPVDFTQVLIKAANDPNGFALAVFPPEVGSQTQWTKRSLELPAEALGQPIIIEFYLHTDDFQESPQAGWYIDDVAVEVE